MIAVSFHESVTNDVSGEPFKFNYFDLGCLYLFAVSTFPFAFLTKVVYIHHSKLPLHHNSSSVGRAFFHIALGNTYSSLGKIEYPL